MKRAIVTGSETFGKYITNPSKWLALSVDGKIIADHEIHSLVFTPIVIIPDGMDDPGTTIVTRAKEIDADVILSFGIASEVKGFRVERSATNWIYNEKYLSTQENNRPLEPKRPERESSCRLTILNGI